MAITIYGIRNCDTIKKARRLLDEQEVAYKFHDYRADGVPKKLIAAWVKKHGWETVLNKRGTTWRQLDDKTKASISESNVVDLLAEHPAMIKRPVTVVGKESMIGFSKDSFPEFIGQ